MGEDQKLDLGSIQIHKKVIADIAVSSLEDIDGVSLAENDMIARVFETFGQKHFPAVTVNVDDDNAVSIEIKVKVDYGINVPDVARQIQDLVRTAVEKMADITIKDVNVNIQGIQRRS